MLAIQCDEVKSVADFSKKNVNANYRDPSLKKRLKCRKPIFIRVFGICFIKWEIVVCNGLPKGDWEDSHGSEFRLFTG